MECVTCGYVEENGNTLLPCGKHYMCDDCLLSGEALDHDCTAQHSVQRTGGTVCNCTFHPFEFTKHAKDCPANPANR